MPKKIKKKKLTPKEELFCQLYATDREFFGNGVQSYIEAYDPDRTKKNWYVNARSSASENLAKPHICERINTLLESGMLNDQNVDKQLGFLVTQHDDKKVKLGAIREYNQLKSRVQRKIAMSSDGPVSLSLDL